MKAGTASTKPLLIDFNKLKTFSKFSKVFVINKTAKNSFSDIHRFANSIETNSRVGSTVQANRHKLRRVRNDRRTKNGIGQSEREHDFT